MRRGGSCRVGLRACHRAVTGRSMPEQSSQRRRAAAGSLGATPCSCAPLCSQSRSTSRNSSCFPVNALPSPSCRNATPRAGHHATPRAGSYLQQPVELTKVARPSCTPCWFLHRYLHGSTAYPPFPCTGSQIWVRAVPGMLALAPRIWAWPGVVSPGMSVCWRFSKQCCCGVYGSSPVA